MANPARHPQGPTCSGADRLERAEVEIQALSCHAPAVVAVTLCEP